MGIFIGTEAITVFGEYSFVTYTQYLMDRLLYQPVYNRWYAQLALAATGFWYSTPLTASG